METWYQPDVKGGGQPDSKVKAVEQIYTWMSVWIQIGNVKVVEQYKPGYQPDVKGGGQPDSKVKAVEHRVVPSVGQPDVTKCEVPDSKTKVVEQCQIGNVKVVEGSRTMETWYQPDVTKLTG